MADTLPPLYETNCPDLNLVARGKVRDIYDFGDKLLLVVSDRLSAFDVIMSNPIPNKGHVLTYVSKFWFEKTGHIIPNHFISCDFEDFPEECAPYRDQLEGRSTLVKKTSPLPVECVIRGYLHGSAVKDYNATGLVGGHKLPEGLELQSPLPEPIFTPATKATSGHDENIDFEQCSEILGVETSEFLRDTSKALWQFGHDHMEPLGITLVDTKFEFGTDENGQIILIDECMTPDSSRYYETETYHPGQKSICYDKQDVRDYLETLDWDKTPPPPALPENVINSAATQYMALCNMLTGGEGKCSGSCMKATAADSDDGESESRVFNATVAVTLKGGVLDVQGQTILQSLGHLHYDNIKSLRMGKWFEVELEATSADEARGQLEKISHDLLSNPVIENFEIDITE